MKGHLSYASWTPSPSESFTSGSDVSVKELSSVIHPVIRTDKSDNNNNKDTFFCIIKIYVNL
jgi:hypothetical protein